VELSPVDAREAPEIERAVTAFARSGNGGLIVTASPVALRHRDLIVTLAAGHRLPAVYTSGPYVAAGGLISYGPDLIDQYRRAAGYVNRILARPHAPGPRARAKRLPDARKTPLTDRHQFDILHFGPGW
jgi:putative ABC transport system substrate-binding protein